jgi:hypothetical protein
MTMNNDSTHEWLRAIVTRQPYPLLYVYWRPLLL